MYDMSIVNICSKLLASADFTLLMHVFHSPLYIFCMPSLWNSHQRSCKVSRFHECVNSLISLHCVNQVPSLAWPAPFHYFHYYCMEYCTILEAVDRGWPRKTIEYQACSLLTMPLFACLSSVCRLGGGGG